MVKVCVIGAAGGIGLPLCLLLTTKLPDKSTLLMYDLVGVHGAAADISHIDRDITIVASQGSLPPKKNDPALTKVAKEADIFVITAGVPRKPGMTRDDLFAINAGIVLDVVETCAMVNPKAIFCIVTNPVNAVVPIAAEVLKKLGCYNKNKLFGISMLDGIRANRFVNQERSPYPLQAPVPVVGGHSDVSIVPLLSQVAGPPISELRAREITTQIRTAGTVVVKAKAGKGSATVSMAYAAATFTMLVVDAAIGKCNHVAYAYVDSDGTQPAKYFAMPLLIGQGGIIKRYPIGKINAVEQKAVDVATAVIKKNIASGEKFAMSKL